jgi:hypothetical protein
MTHHVLSKPAAAARAALLALTLGLALAGCGDQSGSLAGYVPEGEQRDALILTNPQPVVAGDSSQVVIQVLVLFKPGVDGFRIYENPGNEGYHPATPYVSGAITTYTTGWSLAIAPLDVQSNVSTLLMARGSRVGVESGASPITQEATIPAADPLTLLRRESVTLVSPADSANVDSLVTLRWDPVPGATHYIVQVNGRNGLQYLAIVEETQHQVRLGNGLIVQDIPMRSNQFYNWTVTAMNSEWRVFAEAPQVRVFFIPKTNP